GLGVTLEAVRQTRRSGQPVELFLAHVTERWMSDVMQEPGSVHDVAVYVAGRLQAGFVCSVVQQVLDEPPPDLAHLVGMRHPIMTQDLSGSGGHLGDLGQPAEVEVVDDPVEVAFEIATQILGYRARITAPAGKTIFAFSRRYQLLSQGCPLQPQSDLALL